MVHGYASNWHIPIYDCIGFSMQITEKGALLGGRLCFAHLAGVSYITWCITSDQSARTPLQFEACHHSFCNQHPDFYFYCCCFVS